MAPIFIALAEMWRYRLQFGVPMLVGALLAVVYTLVVPPVYEARALLQVQSDQARAPLLKNLNAPGQDEALRQFLIDPPVLADTGKDTGRLLKPENVGLEVVNDHLMAVSYRSANPRGLEHVVDALSFNFIQNLLAPERNRIEQLIVQSQQELKDLNGRLATANSADGASHGELLARQSKLQDDLVQMQTDLRHVNMAFTANGTQAIIWFAESAGLIVPLTGFARVCSYLFAGLLLGLLGSLLTILASYFLHGSRRVVETGNDAAEACGMPLVGVLPWLGRMKVGPGGLHVIAQGKKLQPSEFSELGRLQRTLVRNLRGPLVIVGVNGGEGSSSLALLLAERTATQGKTVALVDMNLKDRMLSQWMGLGDGNWELPKSKGKARWDALHSLPGHENLKVLAAPRHPETLSKLGEAGGLPALFGFLAEQVDVVIVDASPLAAVNRANVDAVAVAAASARTILMAQGHVTLAADLKRAADTLLLVGAPLLGVLLNQRFSLTRRQLLGQMADAVGKVLPPLGRGLRRASVTVKME